MLRRVAALMVLAFLVAGSLSIPVSSAATSGSTATPIKHLIIITMENHSFDNLFGTYPNDASPSNASLVSSVTRPVNLLSGNVTQTLSAVPNGSFSTGNPQEGYSAYHIDWNGGRMNGFLNGSGPDSMKYFTASQMAAEWILAQEFSLGDMYFSSVLSETFPNRLYELAGFSPVLNDYGPPPYIPFDQTVLGQLTSGGISWGYYLNSTAQGISPLNIISGMSSSSENVHTWSGFFSELGNNTLPSVSWLMPIDGNAVQYSQHPSYNVLIGELWLLYTVNRIMHSPEWNSTAIFINYDEGGGYYDQVAPPTLGSHQLGFRVPFIVISPYAKEDYVSHTVLNHASTIAFIDYNWKLPALNSAVNDSNIPLDFFNFNATYNSGIVLRPPLNLSTGLKSIMPQSYNFGPSTYNSISNLADLFPMKFQIPVSGLPYNTTGSSDISPGDLGMGLHAVSTSVFVPLYQTDFAVSGVLIAASALLYFTARKRMR